MRLVTKVNGVVKQDQTTADLIWNEENLIAYTTSILMLYPGDVIATGTLAGTGAERREFLKPGDVVEIELEGRWHADDTHRVLQGQLSRRRWVSPSH